MRWWLNNVRWMVYGSAVALAVLVYGIVTYLIPSSTLQIIRLTESFAFCALAFLYLTLLVSPLFAAFPRLPFKPIVVKSRQALGITAFGFGLLHASLALFGLLGGIGGLWYLSTSYLIAISLSLTALLIMAALAVTSIPAIHKMMGRWWKRLHRLLYIAGVLVLIHFLLLGTHFSDLSKTIPMVSLTAIMFLVLLEGMRLDAYLTRRIISLPSFGPIFTVSMAALSAVVFAWILPVSGVAPSLGIHAAHIQLAQQAAQGTNQVSNIPGLTGDRTKRYTVTFDHPATVLPNQDTPLTFTVNDASSGNPTLAFEILYTKTSHLVIVDNQLEYFSHIHPTLNPPTFTMTTQFPHPGLYHLYLDFQPLGAIEQQFGFALQVGSAAALPSTQVPDAKLTKTFGNTEVTLKLPQPLKANLMTYGQQQMVFELKDATTHQPLTNLKPYLDAYGHLSMVNETTHDFLHVHPTVLVTPGQDGGPDVTFLPIGIYGPIKPGIYRVFAQFNPDNQLFTADFTVNVGK